MLITPAPVVPRSVDIPPTATSGVPASHISHSHRPSPSQHFKSDRQKKAPVGLIVGVAFAILAGVVALFLVRWLFVRRARRRAAFAGQGRTLGGPPPAADFSRSGKQPPLAQPQAQAYPAPPQAYAMPAPQLPPASERDAVELGAYPPPMATQSPPTHTLAGSWSTPFAGAGAGANTAEPGVGSSPAARQAYLAAELRAAQTELERAGRGADTRAVKGRIRALEERQQSAWALGLE